VIAFFEDEIRDPVNIEDLEARIIQLEEENATMKKQLKLDDLDIIDFFSSLQKDIHKNGVDKGWWAGSALILHATNPKPLEVHALIHCEISEASEEVRKGTPPIYGMSDHTGVDEVFITKPEGEAIELADAVIIIISYFESKGWNLGDAIHKKHMHNKTRPHREGYKKY